MRKKRASKKQKEFIQTLVFFAITILSIVGLISYLWVYTEVDETLLAIEIQESTVKELLNDIKELESEIESLSRADVIASRAKTELNMVSTQPETLAIQIVNAGFTPN